MTFLSSSSDDLLDEGTILLHMILLVDGSIPYLDAILLDELDYDAKVDVLLLANHDDAILDVVHDPNNNDDTPDAILLLNLLPDDPTLLMGRCQDTLDVVVQDVIHNPMSRYTMMTTRCHLYLFLVLILDAALR